MRSFLNFVLNGTDTIGWVGAEARDRMPRGRGSSVVPAVPPAV